MARRNKFVPFSRRLSLNIALAVSIVFIVADVTVALHSRDVITKDANALSQGALENANLRVENMLNNIESLVYGSTWLVYEGMNSEKELYHLTRKLVEVSDLIVGSAIAFPENAFKGRKYFSPYSFLDRDGNIRSKQLGTEKYDYFGMEWFKVPYESNQSHWSNPYFDRGGGENMMSTFSVPVIGEDGKVISVITADMSLDWLKDVLTDVKPYPNSFMLLIAENGHILCWDTPDGSGIGFRDVSELASLQGLPEDTFQDLIISDESSKIIPLEGKKYLTLASPLYNGWHSVLMCPYSDIYSDLDDMNQLLVLIAILGILAISAIASYTIRRRTKALVSMSDAARDIAKGNFSVDLPEVSENNEIRQLRDSMSYMQVSLVSYIENLKESTVKNEKFESELNIANKIQAGMLTHDFPNPDGIDVFADSLPAKEVGGDLYDVFIRGDKMFITVGDVSGKGVPASLIMALTLSALRMASKFEIDIDDIMSTINTSVASRNDSQQFVTLFLGVLDLNTLNLDYCNAGHNAIIVNGSYLTEKPNLVIGVMPDFRFVKESIQLSKGDRIVLYTDGVVEAEDENKNLFGEDRLLDMIKSSPLSETSQQTVRNILDAVSAHQGKAGRNDDVTVMTIKI